MASLKRVISLLPFYRKLRLHSCKTLSYFPRSALNYLTYSQSLKTYYCQSIRCLFSATNTIQCASNNDNMASGMTEVRNLDYKSLIDRKSKGGKLIDVREKKELEEDGTIPNSYNIPVGELSSALAMGNDAFKAKYGFEKPDVSDELIFSCRSGKRSLMAYSAAEKAGYKNIYNYAGGWLDWAKNSGS